MKLLIVVLLSLAAVLYLYGIGVAAYISYKNVCPEGTKVCNLVLNANVAFLVTSIGGVLAINFGSLIGLPPTRRKNRLLLSGDVPDKLQVIAAYLYIAGLIAALITWMLDRFSEDPKETVSLIHELSKTFIGVIAGTLAVYLQAGGSNSGK